MNFVIDLSSNKRKEIIYNFIFVIVNRYIKITKYIFIIVKCDNAELTKIFFNKIVLQYNIFKNIVSNRDSIFINTF